MTLGAGGAWWQQTPNLDHDLFAASLANSAAAAAAPSFTFMPDPAGATAGAPAPTSPAFNALFSDPLKQQRMLFHVQ